MFLLLLNIVVDVTLYLHVLTWIFLHAGSVDPSSYVKEDPPSLRCSKCIKQCIANGLTSTTMFNNNKNIFISLNKYKYYSIFSLFNTFSMF